MTDFRSIYAFPWDLAERGLEASLSEFRDLGLNAVTVAGSYHAGKFLRPRSSSPVFFPEDGTVYFRHDPSRYGRIVPIPNSMVAERDILGEVVRKGEIAANAWLVLLHNTPLGSRNLEDCVGNAFGDRYVYNLCPSSPNAREFARGLAADVAANYQVSGITLESPGFAPFFHGFHHEFNLVLPNRWLENLLGLCFCENCVEGAERAGIDAKRLQGVTRKWISDYLAGDVDYPEDMAESFWLADLATDRELSAFLDWRCQVVTSLVAEIRMAVASEVAVAVIPSVGRPTANSWYEGSNLADLRRAAGALEICLYEPESTRVTADFADVRRRLGGTEGLRCVIRPSAPDLNSASEVRAAVSDIAALGAEGISFYNWGFLRKRNLQFVLEALREVAP
ncbi:MAG: hypothetical protein OXF74_04315 [Rhodobacteraceae bacterium]|nr:hypothetical protein [Paracoccaceae bacterium]